MLLPRSDGPCGAGGGAEALNAAATEVWRGLGYEVRPVDCTTPYVHVGALHCLVNVLRRTFSWRTPRSC